MEVWLEAIAGPKAGKIAIWFSETRFEVKVKSPTRRNRTSRCWVSIASLMHGAAGYLKIMRLENKYYSHA